MIKLEEIKRIPTKLEIHEYLITYEYETWKGHKRKTDQRRIKYYDLDAAKKVFKKWSKSVRTMSNVTILDIKELKENKQEIVL